MLSLQFIRENPDIVRAAIKNKSTKIDFDAFLVLDEKKKTMQQEVETLRAKRNELSASWAKESLILLFSKRQKNSKKIFKLLKKHTKKSKQNILHSSKKSQIFQQMIRLLVIQKKKMSSSKNGERFQNLVSSLVIMLRLLRCMAG
jgi:seryl-tRNA synthetase